ncbi:MAG: glycosyltransferase family 4 protein [Pirellulales bacterium]|nr:glycosyltransferase family 4 protein [Pirellulales bacterium]
MTVAAEILEPLTVVVAQIGARMHYAVPRILQKSGMLAHLYTDICATKGWPRLLHALPASWRPASLRRLLSRDPSGIPADKVTAFTNLGYRHARDRRLGDLDETLVGGMKFATEFCRRVVDGGFRDASAAYCFNYGGLEILCAARAQGLFTVLEQTNAPRRFLLRILAEEQRRYPHWERPVVESPAVHRSYDRLEREWELADLIVGGSEFVGDALRACGGPVERYQAVPYGVDGAFRCERTDFSRGKLRVLTLGAVGLRKGTQYVMEAARQAADVAEFRVVGPLAASPEAGREIAATTDLRGPVPRCEVIEHLAWADVFLLPSLCEGSATVTYEALTAGLPVVCTPNTGSVVRDGQDGFIVPIRDAEAIASAIRRLAGDRDLLARMSRSAAIRGQEYDLQAYGKALLDCFQSRFAGATRP